MRVAPKKDDRVDPDKEAILIGVAVTSACTTFGDLTKHRAGIALDLVGCHALAAWARLLQHLRARGVLRLLLRSVWPDEVAHAVDRWGQPV